MGLGNFTNRNNTTYLRIGMGVDDKGRPRAIIGRRCKEGTPGAVQVFKGNGDPATDKDGNSVWRTEHAFIEGMVMAMNRVTKNFNGKDTEELELEIVDDAGELFTLQLEKGDTYWGDLAQRMPNIDWSKSVKLQPYSIAREDNPEKRNRILMVYQDGVKVPKKWNKETPAGEGPPPVTYDNDEKKWMWGKRNNWLDTNPVQQAIDKVTFLNSAGPRPDAPAEVADDAGTEIDDLPF